MRPVAILPIKTGADEVLAEAGVVLIDDDTAVLEELSGDVIELDLAELNPAELSVAELNNTELEFFDVELVVGSGSMATQALSSVTMLKANNDRFMMLPYE